MVKICPSAPFLDLSMTDDWHLRVFGQVYHRIQFVLLTSQNAFAKFCIVLVSKLQRLQNLMVFKLSANAVATKWFVGLVPWKVNLPLVATMPSVIKTKVSYFLDFMQQFCYLMLRGVQVSAYGDVLISGSRWLLQPMMLQLHHSCVNTGAQLRLFIEAMRR